MPALTKYDQMCRAIEEAYFVDEVKDIRDKALALEIYARQAKNEQAERRAVAIRLRAERKVGGLLKEMAEANERETGGKPKPSQRATVKRLADLGVSRTQSSRWQRLAEVPDEMFEQALADATRKPSTISILRHNLPEPKNTGTVIEAAADRATCSSMVDVRKRRPPGALEAEQRQARLPAGKRYDVIYADLLWLSEANDRDDNTDGATEKRATMTMEEIYALVVPAAEDAVLFLSATGSMLRAAVSVMEAWGFVYRSNIVWCTYRSIDDDWTLEDHELLLIGSRGRVAPPNRLHSVYEPLGRMKKGESRGFAKVIEMMFPTLRRVELFAGAARPGWDAMDNDMNCITAAMPTDSG